MALHAADEAGGGPYGSEKDIPRETKATGGMIPQLLKETADEIKHKEFCTNQAQTERKEREKQDLLARIEDIGAAMFHIIT